VIAPEQLSVAVNEVIAGTSAAQSKFIVAGASVATGAMLSFTLIVCETEDVLLHASVKV
jgi:hypothetical protein